MGSNAADEQIELALRRARWIITPIFLVAMATAALAVVTSNSTLLTVVFAIAVVGTIAWNSGFLLWRRHVRASHDAERPSPSLHERDCFPHDSVVTRFGRAVRAGIRAEDVVGYSDSAPDVVLHQMTELAASDGATTATGAAPGVGLTVSVLRRTPDVRNREHLELRGTLSWEAPGRTRFTGRIRPDATMQIGSAVATLFLVLGGTAVISAPVRFTVVDDRTASVFLTVWGLVVCAIATALTWARVRGYEAHVRLLQGAFPDQLRIGSRGDNAEPPT